MTPITLTYIKEKWQHAGFQKYLKNTGWMFGARVISLLTSLFVSIYTARFFGPTDYGTLTFVIAFASIVGSFFLAIDQILLKKINNEPQNTDKIMGSALLLKILNSFLIVVASTVAAFFFASSNVTIILIFTFSLYNIFQPFNSVVDSYFQAQAKVRYLSIVGTASFIFSALIQIFILYMGYGLFVFVAAYSLSQIVLSVSYLMLYSKITGRISWKADVSLMKYFLINSWPFTLSAVATAIYMKVDQIFIKSMLGSEQLGLYIVAVRFSEVWFFISAIICSALLPAILNAEKTNRIVFLERMKRMYSLLFYSSLFICIVMFLISPFIVRIFYGQLFIESIGVFKIYIWSIIGFFLMTGFQQFLLAEHKFKTILGLNMLGMVLSLSLNYLLIPMYGIKGAAYVNIISYSLPLVILVFTNGMGEYRLSMLNGIFKPIKH